MIDTNNWKKFKLSDIGFTNYHGIRQTKADRKDGDIPLLTAGKENQGVASYISNAPSIYKDTITVDMFGNSFFHKGDYAGDDNIYFFINNGISDNAKLFITAILNAVNSKIYAYKEQFRQPQADALSVVLPTTPGGEPDWDYMESYMKKVIEETEEYIRIVGGTPLKIILLMLVSGVSSELEICLMYRQVEALIKSNSTLIKMEDMILLGELR